MKQFNSELDLNNNLFKGYRDYAYKKVTLDEQFFLPITDHLLSAVHNLLIVSFTFTLVAIGVPNLITLRINVGVILHIYLLCFVGFSTCYTLVGIRPFLLFVYSQIMITHINFVILLTVKAFGGFFIIVTIFTFTLRLILFRPVTPIFQILI